MQQLQAESFKKGKSGLCVKPCAGCKEGTEALTTEWVDDVPFLHLGFSDGCIVRAGHFNQPGSSHHRHSMLCQVTKDLLLFTEDGHLPEDGV